jgi:hypothetical protein
MSVKGGVYAHDAYEAFFFFCYVNTWDRHRFYSYIYYLCLRVHSALAHALAFAPKLDNVRVLACVLISACVLAHGNTLQ